MCYTLLKYIDQYIFFYLEKFECLQVGFSNILKYVPMTHSFLGKLPHSVPKGKEKEFLESADPLVVLIMTSH
jgi:hypothetical protein